MTIKTEAAAPGSIQFGLAICTLRVGSTGSIRQSLRVGSLAIWSWIDSSTSLAGALGIDKMLIPNIGETVSRSKTGDYAFDFIAQVLIGEQCSVLIWGVSKERFSLDDYWQPVVFLEPREIT